jgi:hypothetical protein
MQKVFQCIQGVKGIESSRKEEACFFSGIGLKKGVICSKKGWASCADITLLKIHFARNLEMLGKS